MDRAAQLLVFICRILDRVKSSKCGKQYNTWNETTYDHEFSSDHIIVMIVVQEAEIVRLEIEYTVPLNTWQWNS